MSLDELRGNYTDEEWEKLLDDYEATFGEAEEEYADEEPQGPTLEEIATLLDEGAQWLRDNHWYTAGPFHKSELGQHACLNGSLIKALRQRTDPAEMLFVDLDNGFSEDAEARMVLFHTTLQALEVYLGMESWRFNDSVAQSKEEVIAIMAELANRLRTPVAALEAAPEL